MVTNLLGEPTIGALVLNTRDITDRKLAADQLRLVEERERIARDLHDVVVQRLFAIGLGLDALSARAPGRERPNRCVTATDELHHTIRDIRGAIFTLHSDEPELPLRERLRIVIDRAQLTLGFAPAVRLDRDIDAAPDDLHWHLLAIVREGLSNAARHSRRPAVEVSVSVTRGELVAVVADNGRGLPAERDESGLANLRRRAQTRRRVDDGRARRRRPRARPHLARTAADRLHTGHMTRADLADLAASAHVDTFCRDHLPPRGQWPELIFDRAGVTYPERLNCAAELLDATIDRSGPDRPCLARPGGDAWLRRAGGTSRTGSRTC